MRRRGKLDERSFEQMLERIPEVDLFVEFVELDGSTEGKNPAPLRWLRGAEAGEEMPELVVNPDRPGRYEPRCKKRRPKQYDLMRLPRAELRKRLREKDLAA